MGKRIFCVFLVLFLSMSVFVGCEKKVEPQSSEDNKKDTQANEKQKAAEPVTLKMMVDEENKDHWKGKGEILSKHNIKMDYVFAPTSEANQKLMVQLAAGEIYDIIISGNHTQYADFLQKGMLVPLDEYVKEDNFDVAPYGPLYEGMRVNGKVYMLPSHKTTWGLYYNKHIFDAAGVEYPDNDMTWTEFRELAKKLTKGEGEDKIWGAYLHTWPIAWFQPAIQEGKTLIDQDLSSFQKWLQFRVDMEEDGSIKPMVNSLLEKAHYSNEFYTGKVAMTVIGDWFVGMLREAEAEGKINFDWDVAANPRPKGVAKYTTTGMTGGLGVYIKSKKKDAAWEAVKVLCGDTGAMYTATVEGRIPAYMTEHIKKSYLEDSSAKPSNLGVFLDSKVYTEYPPVIGIKDVEKIFNEEAQMTFSGERSAEETIEVIKKRREEVPLN